ncbi:GNAT family N-acetyltransferase [Natronorarus salvus]|uniref:GNAT family N-acetyltransferase n=1 Tax=Natronorarus salvus TaxID=3117733 RepID=UPI002F26B7D9
MEIRDATPEDVESLREVARRSLRESYDFIEAGTIDEAVDQWYSDERLLDLLTDDDVSLPVVDVEGSVAGFAQCHVVEHPEQVGEIHWLHVDPEFRGQGHASALFDHLVSAFEEEGIDRLKGLVFAENEAGNAFYESRGFERAYTREQSIAGGEHTENVWVTVPDDEPWRRETEPWTTEAGEEVFVAYREASIGSEGTFHAAYHDRDRTSPYGWFCSACESFDNSMDTMGRVVCNGCGNVRKATRWDAAYL